MCWHTLLTVGHGVTRRRSIPSERAIGGGVSFYVRYTVCIRRGLQGVMGAGASSWCGVGTGPGTEVSAGEERKRQAHDSLTPWTARLISSLIIFCQCSLPTNKIEIHDINCAMCIPLRNQQNRPYAHIKNVCTYKKRKMCSQWPLVCKQ